MEKKTVVYNRGGIGFFGGLTIVFIVLKLMGEIDWSWAWVLSPIWVPIVLLIWLGVCIYGGVILAEHIQIRRARKRRKRHDALVEAIELVRNETNPKLREKYWTQFLKLKRKNKNNKYAMRLAAEWEQEAKEKGIEHK